ncbi:redoxin domain-containing protein [Candidatus Desulforudis audaxviator]|uniref:redoxin domain-containing protein n=1 Tax=Candidatus Desulforudis audaxviator TaxID=471827 RepID=UPI0002E20C1F|nr:redoxin domain-containing protein [Candidatus Desulforudis audaxviator]AZK59052.1 hypothetical protein Daudx_0497 [Candidatus Desulforudis audaxviator]
MQSLRPVLALLLLAALLLVAAGCGSWGSAPNGNITPPDQAAVPAVPSGTGTALPPPLDWPTPGTPAPAFRLPSLDGGQVSLPADFRGRAVMLLFFSLG